MISGDSFSVGHLKADLTYRPEVRSMHYQFQNRSKRQVVGVIIGASSFEGSVATMDSTMAILLEKMFQSSYNPPGIQGGYSTKPRAWETRTGDTGEILDKDTRKLLTLGPGATASHTTIQLSTGIDIFYPEGPDCGAFTIQIDGGTPVTVTPGPTPAYDKVWKSPVLERGVHTYKITGVGSAQIGNAYIRDQDENVGFRLYNFSRAGASTKQYLDPGADSESTWERLESIKPDFVILGLSHNNITYTTVDQFRQDLETIWSRVNGLDPTKKVWMPCVAQQSTDNRYPKYKKALLDFAKSKDNCTPVDYGEFFVKTTAEAAESGEFHTDNLHMNNTGHNLAAHIIADILKLPSRKTWPATPPSPSS